MSRQIVVWHAVLPCHVVTLSQLHSEVLCYQTTM